MKGSGAFGNICRAAARSPPCASGSGAGAAAGVPIWDRMSIAITLLALLVEATLGYPDRVLRAIGHPVMWSGRMIGALDATLNRDTSSSGRRRAAGFVTAFVVAALPAAAAYAIESSLLLLPLGLVAVALIASTLIAQRSLHDHVERVATALE